MPNETPLYDLMLLLSTAVPDEQRAKILSDVESSISSAGGSVERHDDWGTRPLTFRINHQTEANYHLLQFHGPSVLLESLNHNLGIADGVLRFRIIKVIAGTPPPPDSPPPVIATAVAASSSGGGPAPAAVPAGSEPDSADE